MQNEIQVRDNFSSKEKGILLFLLVIPCLLVFTRPLDNDIWFLLNSGRYVLENGIPHTEPFTIHQDWNFVMQQWLSGVLFWVTFDNLGETGLKLLVLFVNGLIVFLAYRLCMRVSEKNFFVSHATAFAISIMLSPFMTQRPYIYSSLILLAEIYALESYLIKKNNKYLLLLPFLSILLVNLHAAMWPILLVILIPYLINSVRFKFGFLRSDGYESKAIFLASLIMILVGGLNPYGFEGMTYVFRSYGYPEINALVAEMQAVNINTLIGSLIFFVLSIQLLFYCYCIFIKGRMSIRYILLTLGTAYMALSSFRSLSIFAVCGFFPMAYFLKDYEIKNTQKETPRLRKFLAAVLVIVLLIQGYDLVQNSSNATDYEELNATIDYLLESTDKEDIVLYTGYNDGNLAEFKGVPSFIDARAEVFVKKNNNKEDVMLEYYNLQTGKLYYESFLDKYSFTHLIISENDILNEYMPHDTNYEKVYFNQSYSLYSKVLSVLP